MTTGIGKDAGAEAGRTRSPSLAPVHLAQGDITVVPVRARDPAQGAPSAPAGSVASVRFTTRGAPVDSAITQRPPAPAGLREAPEPPSNFTPPAAAPQPPPPSSRPESAWPDESYRGWSGL